MSGSQEYQMMSGVWPLTDLEYMEHRWINLEEHGEFMLLDPEVEYHNEHRQVIMDGLLLRGETWEPRRLYATLEKPAKCPRDIFRTEWSEWGFVGRPKPVWPKIIAGVLVLAAAQLSFLWSFQDLFAGQTPMALIRGAAAVIVVWAACTLIAARRTT